MELCELLDIPSFDDLGSAIDLDLLANDMDHLESVN